MSLPHGRTHTKEMQAEKRKKKDKTSKKFVPSQQRPCARPTENFFKPLWLA